MIQYLDLLEDVLVNGVQREDRTGVGTRSIFGAQLRYDLEDGFPVLTTKKLHLKSIVVELIWFLMGDTKIDFLHEHGVTIWDEWADRDGDLGPIYGKQWRYWEKPDGTTVDQIEHVVDRICNDPSSRRLVISAWNVSDIDVMAIPPCHTLFQFHVSDGRLSCQLYQRSGDMFLGVPYNITSYSLLLMMMAQTCGLRPGEFIHTLGDAHLYNNHVEQAREQLTREPRSLPEMRLNPDVKSVFDFGLDDFELVGYDPHPHIRADVAV